MEMEERVRTVGWTVHFVATLRQKAFDWLLNTITLNFRVLILVSALLLVDKGSVDGILVGVKFSAPAQPGSGIHPACLFPHSEVAAA